MIGERIAGERSYNLFSDPHFPGIEESPFVVNTHDGSDSSVFDTGQPLPRVDWVYNGVLNALCTPRTVAVETGLPFTPNVGNLILDVPGGDGTLDDVIARTESGLLVNCLWYIRDLDEASMMVTGTTRDGVYEVRDGEVIGAVNNFRFNESPLSVLSRIHDAGTSVLCQTRENAEHVSDYLMPTLVIDEFNMSSISDAL
jgi:predicted Zn-dependent protease